MLLSILEKGKWEKSQNYLFPNRNEVLDVHLESKATRFFINRIARRSMGVTYLDFTKAYDSVDCMERYKKY